jgi:hypothetical protein
VTHCYDAVAHLLYQLPKRLLIAAEQYGASKSPTLLVVAASGEPTIYSGPLKAVDVARFLEGFATPKPASSSSSSSSSSSQKSTTTPPPPEVEINQVFESTDQESFTEHCLSKAICGIAILDHSSEDFDAAVHEQQLAALLAVAKAHKKQARFTWVDGVKHAELIQALDIGSDLPQLVILSPKKKTFAQHLGTVGNAALCMGVEAGGD